MTTKKAEAKAVAFNLPVNTASALTYVLGWVTGLLFLLVEKENKTVRFHAMQSLLFFAAMTVISFVPLIGWLLSPFVLIVSFIVWLLCVYKAYNGEEFELPVVGKIAREKIK